MRILEGEYTTERSDQHMAQKLVLVDDLTGHEGAETVTFAINGVQYEIDLVPTNQAKLEKALEPFIKAGRKRGQKRVRAARPTKIPAAVPQQTIRDWARKNGMKVSDKGKIRKEVMDAFNEAHSKSDPSDNGANNGVTKIFSHA